MAVEVTLEPIVSGYNISKINSNFVAIEEALEDAISRTGSLPNTMEADLDLNSQDILNVNVLDATEVKVGGISVFPGDVSVQGDKGWSPVFALVTSGARRVLQLVGYVGGTGIAPTSNVGLYVGATAMEADIANGVDLRGPTGVGTGDMLNADNLQFLTNFTTAKTNLSLQNVDNTSDVNKPVSTAQAAADLVAQTQEVGINLQTGTTYTLVIGDAGKFVSMNNASSNTLTVPPNSSIAFSTKTRIDIGQKGAGQTSIAAGVGVTIRSSGGKLKLSGQYSGGTLIKIDTDEWWLFGDLST